ALSVRRETAISLRITGRRLMAEHDDPAEDGKARWKKVPQPTERQLTDVNQIAPYFVEWVRTTLEPVYGERLYNGGLRIYTSLDIEMQRAAEAAMDSGWARRERDPTYRWPTQQETMD